MSVTSKDVKKTEGKTWRRFKDGESEADWRDRQEIIFQAGWTHKCPEYMLSTPPCQGSCPAGEDIRSYLNIVRGIEKPPVGADGKPTMSWQEFAWRRLTEANPFPAVMGRVCPAPCESGCNRNQVEENVGINSVEHFLGNWALENKLAFNKPAKETGKKVAIIGGGPAGLAAAYQLRLKGHACTIFDDHAELGGMMRYGIPGFRTPREVLDGEIQRILDLGVETKLNCRVGKDISMEQIEKDFDAVIMGLGAQAGRALPVEGADAPNCVTAMSFLRAFNEGRLQHVGDKVVVIGGGDTSIDVATVARRLGKVTNISEKDLPENVLAGHVAHDVATIAARQGVDVVLISRATIDKMAANKHEIEQAQSEGIEIVGGVTPVAVIKGADGRATALRVADFEMVGKDMKIKEGTERDIPATLIVSAIGQAVDFTGLESYNNNNGLIKTDKNYRFPGKENVFIAGDVIRPHLLTTAIGHARICVDGIDAYLAGEELDRRPKVDVAHWDMVRRWVETGHEYNEHHGQEWGTSAKKDLLHNFEDRSSRYVIPSTELFLGHFAHTPRNKRNVIHLDKDSALGNFQDRLGQLSEKEVVDEAKRCMSCGLCFECDNCVIYCPQTAVFKVKKKDNPTTGRYVDTDYTKCIGCHICADVCPTGYIVMGMGD
ncbi:NADPH-dependent glutamate synthase beta subunit-like oxidoreductase [Sulfuritortus calidifontis]|uniref:NADPH-dependent glutamate synthase beta subunit-like oxidoreductase n=1 Tax=Sulfuritortus calidifontis TaxID=1914471 RepID=A0A4R3JYT9_9PROT|nr:NAD(P)-binding protein [Sulfuritortus calidifontis]TCS73874.1 NADPH-dependent glutamate synthase beta subunit-like oxidoreductase [Sulfuritortus calidifontis]